MFSPVPQPPVDPRTGAKVAAQVRDLLPRYVRDWKGSQKGPDGIVRGPDEALVRVFSRFCEIVIDRLNRAPEKNFLAFLDFLGASPLPPQPARAPLTFYLAQKAPGAVVALRTQVAAPPAPGEKDPIVFETEEELQVSAACLDSLFIKDPIRDAYTDGTQILPPSLPPPGQITQPPATLTVFRGDQPIPHVLYVGVKLPPACPVLKELRLKVGIDGPAAGSGPRRSAVWEAIKGILPPPAAGTSLSSVSEDERFTVTPLTPSSDTTAALTQSGDVVFEIFTPMPEVEVNGVRSQWLRCRFVAPPAKETDLAATAPSPETRNLKNVTVHVEIERANLPIKLAFANAVPLDLSKEFPPFGVRPRLGDTFYLACPEAFSLANAAVTLHFDLLNPSSGSTEPTIPPAQPRDIKLVWEFWDGRAWTRFGTSQPQRARLHDEETRFSDGSDAISNSGDVTFTLPTLPQLAIVNGQKDYWVRVRIAGGDYGEEAHLERDPDKWNKDNPAAMLVPATLAPPILAKAGASYVISSDSAPDAVFGCEDFRYTPAGSQGLKLFQPAEGGGPALYLGFTAPGSQLLGSSTLTTYFGLASAPPGKAASSPSSSTSLVWEYWNGASRKWSPLTVRDGTHGFRNSGVIPFLTPRDLSTTKEFGRERYWLRARKADPAADFEPLLASVLLNTTMAIQAVTVTDEVLGSSNGKPNQAFRANHVPVLEGQILHVREPTLPSVEATELITSEEGEGAVSRSLHPFSKREEIWVRWHLVPNFNVSGPQSCHYILNRLTGEVKFGDGEHGRIPPAITGNIRMTRYRSGGGTGGNKPAGSIAQLRTTLPYVERAANLEAASGGADPETRSALLDRAPRGVRHGRRAVTEEDFEDLAILASPGVGRARCVPLRDLAADPDGKQEVPGVVSLVLVPRSSDPKPLPSLGLCDQVRGFLDNHRLMAADLVLVPADYVAIRVETELAITDANTASDVEWTASQELRRFLHPLTGRNGAGWDFCELPADSDLYTLLEAIPGVSHVRQLRTARIPDRPGAETTSRCLIYSSEKHQVTVSLEE